MWVRTATTPPRLLNTAHLTSFHVLKHEREEKWGVIAEPGGYLIGVYLSNDGAIKALTDLQNKLNDEPEMSIYNGMADLMHELKEAIL